MAAGRQDCSICMDSFKNPKLISCHHSFCCKCLENYVRVNLRNGQFNCPICRASVELPQGGVSALQSNFYIDTDAGDKFACDICGPKNVAYSRCLDCEENLCQSCCYVHEKSKGTRHHKIRDLGTLDSETKGKIRQRIFCQDHPDEEMKLVCQDCKVVICMVCKVVKHENHGTEPVAVAAAEMKKTLQTKLNECLDKLRRIDASKQTVKELDRKINDAEQEELRAVDDQGSKLHKAIDQELAKMKAKINNVYHDLRQQNAVLAGVIEDDFKMCSNTKDNVQTLNDQGTDMDIINKGPDLKQLITTSISKTDHTPDTYLEKKLFSSVEIKSSELTSLVGMMRDSTKLSPEQKQIKAFPKQADPTRSSSYYENSATIRRQDNIQDINGVSGEHAELEQLSQAPLPPPVGQKKSKKSLKSRMSIKKIRLKRNVSTKRSPISDHEAQEDHYLPMGPMNSRPDLPVNKETSQDSQEVYEEMEDKLHQPPTLLIQENYENVEDVPSVSALPPPLVEQEDYENIKDRFPVPERARTGQKSKGRMPDPPTEAKLSQTSPASGDDKLSKYYINVEKYLRSGPKISKKYDMTSQEAQEELEDYENVKQLSKRK